MASSAPPGFGSTYLSPKITTYADLVYRCKVLLGFPYQKDELYDEQWATFIDDAIETATEWGAFAKEEYIVFSSDFYVPGCGVKLDDIVNCGCWQPTCTVSTVTETVTSIDYFCDNIETTTAYLSVTPFIYPTTLDVNDPNSTAFTGSSGQFLNIYFDPKNPWKATNVCQADCITISPVSSQWFQLASNPALSGIVFDFVDNPLLNTLANQISAFTSYPLSAVPLISMGAELSAVPTSYYDIAAFYPADNLAFPPVEACVNIGNGLGYIYPKCNTSLINACSALSSQYNISPLWDYSLSGNFYVGTDKQYPLSATDISKATHVMLLGIPSCTLDGSIPLISNDGIVATFVLCNTAISTNGPMYMDDVQFFYDYKLPFEAEGSRCGWSNNGFTMKFNNSSYDECIRYTPSKVKVDVSFCKNNAVMNIGTITTTVSANFDETLNRRRKVHGVFNVDDATPNGGFFGGSGGDVLFNFDYALMGSVFGYDLQGQRNFGHPGGFNLTTFHMAKSFVEHTRKMLRYVSYHFDPKTQYLKVHPEPGGNNGRQAYILGVKTESPVEEMLSNYFIREYVLARAMQTIGIVRSKFGNATLYSGQTITGDKLLDLGNTRIEQLMKELRDEYRYSEPASWFFG